MFRNCVLPEDDGVLTENSAKWIIMELIIKIGSPNNCRVPGQKVLHS